MRFPSDQFLSGDRDQDTHATRDYNNHIRRHSWIDRYIITCRGGVAGRHIFFRPWLMPATPLVRCRRDGEARLPDRARETETAVDRPRRGHGRTRRKRRAAIIIIDCYHRSGISGEYGGPWLAGARVNVKAGAAGRRRRSVSGYVARPCRAIPARKGENSGVTRLVARRGPNWHAPLPPSLSRPHTLPPPPPPPPSLPPPPLAVLVELLPPQYVLSVSRLFGWEGRGRYSGAAFALSVFSIPITPTAATERERVRVCIPSSCAPGNRRRRIVLTRVSRRHLPRYVHLSYDNGLSRRTEFWEGNIADT